MAEKTYPNTDITLEMADVSFGAVELKDASGEHRAQVDEDGDLHVYETNSPDIRSALDSLDGKVTLCDTSAVTIAAQPSVQLAPDASTLSIASQAVTVTSAGTPVPLAAGSSYTWRVDITAKSNNLGKVFVGNSSVHYSSLPVAPLEAGESYTITCPAGSRIDLAGVYLDAEQNGEGVVLNIYTIA